MSDFDADICPEWHHSLGDFREHADGCSRARPHVEHRPAGIAGFTVLSDPDVPPGYIEVRDDNGTLQSRHRIG